MILLQIYVPHEIMRNSNFNLKIEVYPDAFWYLVVTL